VGNFVVVESNEAMEVIERYEDGRNVARQRERREARYHEYETWR
jgi:hypothetical protein